MNHGFETDENDISDMLEGIQVNLKNVTKSGLAEAGEVVKQAVQSNIPYSKQPNASGRPRIRDDVRIEIKVFGNTGGYVKVKGGPKTKGLWQIINDGHVAPNGRMARGEAFHFLDRASEQSSAAVDGIMDRVISEVMNGRNN